MDRINEIIGILINSKDFITMDNIAEQLNVSNKSVRNDLKKIEEVLKDSKLLLEKKPRCGVRLLGSEKDRINYLSNLKGMRNIEPYSPEARKKYILKRLFMDDHSVTMRELAEELFVSRVTIFKDLDGVEQWLSEQNLQLKKKPNYGIEIVGAEKHWRNAIISLINIDKDNSELKEMLYENCNSRIDYRTMAKLKELMDIDFKQLERILCNAEEELQVNFTNDAFESFIIHLVIAMRRLLQNNDIELSEEILNNLKEKEEYNIASKIAGRIAADFDIKLPEDEIGYIALHLLGAKMQAGVSDKELNIVDDKEEKLPVVIAKEIIAIAEKALGIGLGQDNQLLNGLVMHLRPTINRVKYGLTLRNPMLEEIEESYPEGYGVAWMASRVFEKHLGKKVSKEEIGYMALHLQAAIERQRKPLRVVVVCTTGIGTSQLVATRLEKRFRQIEIVDVVSQLKLNSIMLEDVDLIVSTVPVHIEKPLVTISPLLNENDIRKLEIFMEQMNDSNGKRGMTSMLRQEFIEINAGYETKEELLRTACEKLIRNGCVDDEFLDAVIDREEQCSTEVGRGLAIPHGDSKHVLCSTIYYVKLCKPMLWQEERVDLIMLLCIKEEHAGRFKHMMRNLYRSIDSETAIERLKAYEDKSQIIKHLEEIFDVD